MNRNLAAAIAASAVVIVVVILGFRFLGSPHEQRLIQSDNRRILALESLAGTIHASWNAPDKVLPQDLSRFPPDAISDPITHVPFSYHARSGSSYELCGEFDAESPADRADAGKFWKHPKGAHCFTFDASAQPPPAPYAYRY